MNNPFKAGDVVVSKETCHGFIRGREYTVAIVDGYYVHLKEDGRGGWDWDRFELKHKTTTSDDEPQFLIKLSDSGDLSVPRYDALQHLLFAHDISWIGGLGTKRIHITHNYKYLLVDRKGKQVCHTQTDNHDNAKVYDCVADLPRIVELLATPYVDIKPKSVVLNDKHTALVYKDKIVVGCQTFPIDVLHSLVAARDSFK